MIANAAEQNGSARWLKPEELAKLSSLELRAKGVVEGFLQGLHRSPFVGYSVEFLRIVVMVPAMIYDM